MWERNALKAAVRSKEDIYQSFRLYGTMVMGEKNHLLLLSGLQGTQSPQGRAWFLLRRDNERHIQRRGWRYGGIIEVALRFRSKEGV